MNAFTSGILMLAWCQRLLQREARKNRRHFQQRIGLEEMRSEGIVPPVTFAKVRRRKKRASAQARQSPHYFHEWISYAAAKANVDLRHLSLLAGYSPSHLSAKRTVHSLTFTCAARVARALNLSQGWWTAYYYAELRGIEKAYDDRGGDCSAPLNWPVLRPEGNPFAEGGCILTQQPRFTTLSAGGSK